MGEERPVAFNTNQVAKIDPSVIDDLKRKAAGRADKRYRLCLHHANEDVLHQMIIVHSPGIYVRPHRHDHAAKSLHAIEGRMLVVLFDDCGRPVDRFVIAPQGGSGCFLVRLERGQWHTELPLEDPTVFLETLEGPFRPQTHSTFAPWSPEPSDTKAVEAFLAAIQQGGIPSR